MDERFQRLLKLVQTVALGLHDLIHFFSDSRMTRMGDTTPSSSSDDPPPAIKAITLTYPLDESTERQQPPTAPEIISSLTTKLPPNTRLDRLTDLLNLANATSDADLRRTWRHQAALSMIEEIAIHTSRNGPANIPGEITALNNDDHLLSSLWDLVMNAKSSLASTNGVSPTPLPTGLRKENRPPQFVTRKQRSEDWGSPPFFLRFEKVEEECMMRYSTSFNQTERSRILQCARAVCTKGDVSRRIGRFESFALAWSSIPSEFEARPREFLPTHLQTLDLKYNTELFANWSHRNEIHKMPEGADKILRWWVTLLRDKFHWTQMGDEMRAEADVRKEVERLWTSLPSDDQGTCASTE